MAEATETTPVVLLDGEPVPWHAGLTVATLVARRGVDPRAVATALNGAFVPLTSRGDTPVRPGDVVLLFQAIVGG
jgi:sulfur carrier protein